MRLTPFALTSLLVVSMAPFQSGLAEDEEAAYMIVLDDGDNAVVRYVGADFVQHGGGGGFLNCGGQAPRETHCSTGEHAAASFYTHGILFPLCTVALEMGSCYAGTVESVLRTEDGAERILRVHKVTALDKGVVDLVETEGAITPGGPIVHECTSYHHRQSVVEGGLGDWRCYLVH